MSDHDSKVRRLTQQRLSELTTLGVGGPAEAMYPVDSFEAFERLVESLSTPHEISVVLGGGSNVVVADEGVAGAVLLLRTSDAAPPNGTVTSHVVLDAMLDWPTVAQWSVSSGLQGLETLVGIPGTVGGAVVQNIGAYGCELAERVTHVVVFDRQDAEIRELTRDECGFGYRTSRFKRDGSGRYIVLKLGLRLSPGALHVPRYAELEGRLRSAMEGATQFPIGLAADIVLSLRRSKSMVYQPGDPESRGVGSFFVNPIVGDGVVGTVAEQAGLPEDGIPQWKADAGTKLSAGWLIERSGFERGTRSGNVGLCANHALGLVNATGRASASEVLAFAGSITTAVRQRFGVDLEMEPVVIGISDAQLTEYGVRRQPRAGDEIES